MTFENLGEDMHNDHDAEQRGRQFKRLAMLALSAGEYEAARLAVTEALALQRDVGALHLHALALAGVGDLDAAEKSQEEAERLGLPDHMAQGAWDAFGDYRASAGEMEDALRCYLRAASIPTGSGGSAFKAAEILLRRGETEESRRVIEDKAVLLKNGGRPDQALTLLRLAEALFESLDLDSCSFLPLMSDCQLEARSPAFLKEAFKRLDQEGEEDEEIWYALGCDLDKAGIEEMAILAYRRAIGCAPGHAQAWVNLGFVLQKNGKEDRAREAWELALDLDPTLPEVHQNLGMLASLAGDLDVAEQRFRQAIQQRSDFALAWHELGSVLIRRETYAEAADALRQAVRHDPENAGSWLLLGVALLHTEDLPGARRAVEKVLILEPDCPEALNNLGVILENLDDHAGALTAWRRALELDPDLEEARRNIEEFDHDEHAGA